MTISAGGGILKMLYFLGEIRVYQGIVFLASTLFVLMFCVFTRKTDNKKSFLWLKIFTVLFCAVGFFRFIWVINGSFYSGVFYDKVDVLQSILRWGYNLSYCVLPMCIFFDNRLFRNVALYICLPFSMLSTIFLNDYMVYFLDSTGRGLHFVEWFRYAYFMFELVLANSLPVIMGIKSKHCFNVKSWTEWKNFLIATPLIFLLLIPVYLPQSLFGYSSIVAKAFSMGHIVWLLITFLIVALIYIYFRFKDYNARYQVCIFLCLALFFHYNSLYLMEFSIPRLPIQLCNLGAYFFMICVPFKLTKMFNFAFLVNIVGALIAMVAPDSSGGLFGFWNVHFIYEHSLVLIVPAVCMLLRIFPRIKVNSLKHMWFGFSCYFLFCLISGTILNGFAVETGFKVNYFYIFDLDKAFDYFPFLSFSSKFALHLGRFVLYPVFQLIIYLGFIGIVCLFYLFTQMMYKVIDDHLALRKSRIELFEKITKKKSKAPTEFVD